MRLLITAICCLGVTAYGADDPKKSTAKSSTKAGLKTPGIQIPFESLKSEADIAIDTPGAAMMSGSVLIPSKSKDQILRIDPKTNKPPEPRPKPAEKMEKAAPEPEPIPIGPIADIKQPCSGLVNAFGSFWIPSCGSQSLVRVDPKTLKIAATIATGVADVQKGIVATADSVWLFTDSKTTLSRIDPVTNKVVDQLRLPANCDDLASGENSLWVTCPSETRILRINPSTNLVDKRIEVSAGARAVTFGAGSVWVLCERDGKIDRIDPKTNKVIKTIELNVPNAAGDIAFGDGFLWVTQNGFPLTRIDVTNEKEKVAQQFWGDGGGRITATAGAIWLTNIRKNSVSHIDPKRVLATLAE
jgi:virginiamycin B lyase